MDPGKNVKYEHVVQAEVSERKALTKESHKDPKWSWPFRILVCIFLSINLSILLVVMMIYLNKFTTGHQTASDIALLSNVIPSALPTTITPLSTTLIPSASIPTISPTPSIINQHSMISPVSEVNKYPIYLYIAAIEGSGHTGVEQVIVKWLSSGNYLPELEVKEYTKQGKTNGWGSDDTWIVPLIDRLRLWNGEGEVPVYIRSKEGSFPSYLTDRQMVIQKIDINNPIDSIKKLVTFVQQKRHPSSLLSHASFGENLVRKSYDFKIIWLQKDFLATAYSRWKDWGLDGTLEMHAVLLAIFELYIATEIRDLEMAGLGRCVRLYTDHLGTKEGQESGLRNLTRLFQTEVDCKKCFEDWRVSRKRPRSLLSKKKIEFIDRIGNYVNEVKQKHNICIS